MGIEFEHLKRLDLRAHEYAMITVLFSLSILLLMETENLARHAVYQ